MIKVIFEGKEYKLGFTAETVADAQADGLVVQELAEKPNVMIPLLVYHAGRAHNKKFKRRVATNLYKDIRDKDVFLEALLDEYAAVVSALFEDNEQGNATWTQA